MLSRHGRFSGSSSSAEHPTFVMYTATSQHSQVTVLFSKLLYFLRMVTTEPAGISIKRFASVVVVRAFLPSNRALVILS